MVSQAEDEVRIVDMREVSAVLVEAAVAFDRVDFGQHHPLIST